MVGRSAPCHQGAERRRRDRSFVEDLFSPRSNNARRSTKTQKQDRKHSVVLVMPSS
jgi:hypothetical protein